MDILTRYPRLCLGLIEPALQAGKLNLAEIRLYLFPHVPSKTLHLLTIGDKNSQSRDINVCRDMVKEINTREEKRNERASEPEPPENESSIP